MNATPKDVTLDTGKLYKRYGSMLSSCVTHPMETGRGRVYILYTPTGRLLYAPSETAHIERVQGSEVLMRANAHGKHVMITAFRLSLDEFETAAGFRPTNR